MKRIHSFIFGLIAATLLLLSLPAQAQKVLVTGKVLDENGDPLVGAGIIEQGTTNGVVADIDGNFTIAVPSTAILEVNFIGYDRQEVPVRGKKEIIIHLSPDIDLLEEAVVIGYGTVRRSDLTGSVSSVSAKAIEDFKTSSVVEALGGKIAGVNITASDGTPGAGYDVKIRGIGTVNGESAPLYIVDGFEVDDIDFLANQDIQSIDVLKDASASAIYGARAANGVVLVTTKSGREGKPQVTYNGSVSYRVLSKKLEVLSPYEFVKLQMEANPTKYANTYYQSGNDDDGNPYKYQSLEDYIGVKGIDWQDEAFSPTWSQNHDVSLMGGTKQSQYTMSFSHFDENGIFKNSGYEKNSARVKISEKLTKWATFNGSINYTGTKKTGVGTSSILANLLRYRPTGGLKTTDEELRTASYDPISIGDSNFSSSNNNPITQAESVTDKRTVEQWIGNASLSLQLMRGLSFKTSGTYNASYQRRDIFYGDGSSQAYRAGTVYGSTQTTRVKRWSNNNVLTYKRTFKKKHSVDFTLGHEYTYSSTEYLYGQATDFPVETLGNDNLALGATPSAVETSKTESKRLSFFVRGFYNFDDRYMITATARADASTVFSDNNKWGFFPSFAGAWTISNEPFMKSASEWLTLLKLRVGWGTVGNDRISSYLSMNLYEVDKYGWGTTQTTVLLPKQIANTDLKWEGATTTNIGVDFNVFDSRINLTVDAFLKDTKDLLLAQSLALVTGFESQWQNVGKIRNKGLEITVNSVNINKRRFSWTTDFNISFIKNKLLALQDGTDYIFSLSDFNSNYTSYDYVSYVGSALGDIYGYVFDGVYQYSDFYVKPDGTMTLKEGVADISDHAGTDVVPGMVKYKDIDGDGVITTDDRTVIGNGYPDWYGGITNTFTILNFDLSFMFQFSYGNDIYNATRMYSVQSQDDRANQLIEVADRWTTTNASNSVPAWDGYVKSELYSRFIEDGSYIRLKNLTVGYTLPERITRKAYISKLRVYTTMQNLFVLTKYSGYDPEVNTKSSPLMPGFDWGAYPKNRTFTFGIELQF